MRIKILYFLAFLLIWIVVFWTINRIITKKLSYAIDKRYLHFRLIIAGLIFSLVTAIPAISSYSLLLIDKIINMPLIAPFFNFILPNRAYELIYIVLCNLGLNLLYSLAFTIILRITKTVFFKSQKFIEYKYCLGSERVIHAPWCIVNRFYDEETGKIALTKKGYFIGKCAKGIKWVFAFIWITEFAILYGSVLWGKTSWNEMVLSISKSVYLLPMVAFFLIEQVQLFLEGPETTEVGTFGTVDIQEKMIGDMDSLMRRYKTLYADNGVLLYSEKGKKTGINRQGLESNDLGNQQIDDCIEPGILAVITNQLRESGIQQTPNYQNALVSLLNSNSVYIRDSADGEFVVYLCAYLNYYVSQGFSAVIVCPDRTEVSKIKNELEAIRNKLVCISGLWTVCEFKELSPVKHTGILICTGEELLSVDFKKRYEYFAADIICAVVINSSVVMSFDSIRTEKIFSRIKALPHLNQYIFMAEEDNESLRSKIKQHLPEGIRLFSFGNDVRLPKTNIMIWKEESRYKPQLTIGIGNQASPFLGTAFPLALVAVKYDLPKINIVPDSSRGDVFFFGGARQSNEREIILFLEKKADLNSIIRYSSLEAMKNADLKMLVVYDVNCNFYDALWKWLKYAGKDGTLIHVVSPHYMLREYFAANIRRKSLLYSNNEFKALLPNDTVLKRTLMASLLVSMADIGLTEDELIEIAEKHGWKYSDLGSLLKDAILTVRAEKEFHNVYEHFMFQEDPPFFGGSLNGFIHHVRVKLSDSKLLAQQKTQISLARLSYKTNEYFELPILSGNIWNYYLPKQLICFRGSFYMVSSVDTENGIVHAKPANPANIPDYYVICDYSLTQYKMLDNCVDNPILDCNICEAKAKKYIYGYVASNDGNSFSAENKPSINRINNSETEVQTITMDTVSVLEINFSHKSFEFVAGGRDSAEGAIALLCVILNGLFKTLYPNAYQNIAAVPDSPIDESLIERVTRHVFDCPTDDIVKATIPRINVADAHNTDDNVKIYIIEFSCIEYGLVKSVYDNIESIFNMAYEYLDWYIASNRNQETESGSPGYIQGRYLHFGMTSMPGMFAPETLYSLLREILGRTDSETVIEPDPTESVSESDEETTVCSFCNREMIFGWRLSDGRCMCTHCHDHQKTQKDEIKRLFLEAKKMLEVYYHIDFRKDINVRFQSADAIRKVAGGIDNGRIVGFYNHDKRQLWIEARGPSIAMESTIVHELTHAWQFDSLPLRQFSKAFPLSIREKRVQLLLEGHAVYVEIEAMAEKGEPEYAKRLKDNYLKGDDVYSLGYRLISECFKNMEIEGNSASSFVKMQNLVDGIINGEATVSWPEGY